MEFSPEQSQQELQELLRNVSSRVRSLQEKSLEHEAEMASIQCESEAMRYEISLCIGNRRKLQSKERQHHGQVYSSIDHMASALSHFEDLHSQELEDLTIRTNEKIMTLPSIFSSKWKSLLNEYNGFQLAREGLLRRVRDHNLESLSLRMGLEDEITRREKSIIESTKVNSENKVRELKLSKKRVKGFLKAEKKRAIQIRADWNVKMKKIEDATLKCSLENNRLREELTERHLRLTHKATKLDQLVKENTKKGRVLDELRSEISQLKKNLNSERLRFDDEIKDFKMGDDDFRAWTNQGSQTLDRVIVDLETEAGIEASNLEQVKDDVKRLRDSLTQGTESIIKRVLTDMGTYSNGIGFSHSQPLQTMPDNIPQPQHPPLMKGNPMQFNTQSFSFFPHPQQAFPLNGWN